MTRRPAAGFTLVELLVSLALMALLSVLLLGGLRMSRTAVVRGQAASRNLADATLAFPVIRRQLARADPLAVGGDAHPPIAFAGDDRSILFVAPPGAYLALGGQEITWLTLEPDADGGRIVLRFRPLERGRDVWPPELRVADMQTVVLLTGVTGAEFSYFGRTDPSQDPRWWRDWHDQTALPSLIRLAVASGGRTWPDLILSPRLGKPGATAWLPALLCRREVGPPCIPHF